MVVWGGFDDTFYQNFTEAVIGGLAFRGGWNFMSHDENRESNRKYDIYSVSVALGYLLGQTFQ